MESCRLHLDPQHTWDMQECAYRCSHSWDVVPWVFHYLNSATLIGRALSFKDLGGRFPAMHKGCSSYGGMLQCWHSRSGCPEPISNKPFALVEIGCVLREQIQHLVDEEQAAYSAQSAVMPLRELASNPNPGQGAKPGAELPGGATELMGGHTKPPPAAAGFAGAAQERARGVREAQQAELEQKTGDTLYRSAGGLSTCRVP